jgi:hypothetical protein
MPPRLAPAGECARRRKALQSHRPAVSVSMTISRMLYAASILDIVMITPFSSPNGSSPDTSLQVCPTSPQAGRAGVAPAISAGPPMTIARTLTPRQRAC